jgi:predicted metal-dependent enzyme (double-stranded beta helix superfamily)
MTVSQDRIHAVAELVERFAHLASEDRYGPEGTTALLAAALAEPSDWLDERYQERPDDRDWMLYPLYRSPDHRASMLAVVFKPGVTAPVHDHGAWAVIGIYRGRERETWFRRTDDGGTPGSAQLVADRSFVNATGSVHLVPAGIIHTVEALDGVDAVSIHVYGTDIVTQDRNEFDLETGRVQPYRPPVTEPAADG